MMLEKVNCPLCGSKDSRFVLEVPDLLLNRLDVISRFERCEQCGLVFQNPRPNRESVFEHYPPEYDSYELPTDQRITTFGKIAAEYGGWKRIQYIQRFKKGGRLLDVGCATGWFLHSVPKDSWEPMGVEPNPQAAAIAREKFGLEVKTGFLTEADFPDGYFDVVTMWDVLEHVHDPIAELNEIRRILHPHGVLILRLPNADSWSANVFGKYWAGLDSPRHLFVFHQNTIECLLNKTGFVVRNRKSISGEYPSFVLSLRFWVTGKRKSLEKWRRIETCLFHPAIQILAAPFFWFCGFIGQSSSIAIAASPSDERGDQKIPHHIQ